MDENEFRLAQLCGLNIIINADDLEEVQIQNQSPIFNAAGVVHVGPVVPQDDTRGF